MSKSYIYEFNKTDNIHIFSLSFNPFEHVKFKPVFFNKNNFASEAPTV